MLIVCMSNMVNRVDEAVQVNRRDVDSEAYIMSCDYIQSKLRRSNLPWPDCPELPEPSAVRLVMRSLGEEFERLYSQVFVGMCDSLQITLDTAYPTFFGVADELFREGITWSRIVALFSFGGALAEQCVHREMPQLVTYVADWVALYTEARLSQWITENGGWDAFVQYYERRGPDNEQWRRVARRVGIGGAMLAGALGVVTLGALLAGRS